MSRNSAELVLLSIVFTVRRDDFHIASSVRRCEKLASGRDARRNRLPHLPCCPKVCKLGGAGGFACRANFSHLLQRGDGFTGQTVPALTLGAMWPPRNTANRYRLRFTAMRGSAGLQSRWRDSYESLGKRAKAPPQAEARLKPAPHRPIPVAIAESADCTLEIRHPKSSSYRSLSNDSSNCSNFF